jgi:hypothetical protein
MMTRELKRPRPPSWEDTGDATWDISSAVTQPAVTNTSVALPRNICYGAVRLMNFASMAPI